MQQIKFSICIPNYNYAGYIGKTIQSALNQTYPPFEIIVADNCSTDNSIDVITAIKDERIRLIRNKVNVGFGPNLDIATQFATGDFIILLSSDDLMNPNALETYAEVINRNADIRDKLVLFSSFNLIDGNDKVLQTKPSIPIHIKRAIETHQISIVKEENTTKILGHDVLRTIFTTTLSSAGQFCTTCYSRSLYDIVSGYRSMTTIIPDATFIYKLAMQNAVFAYVDANLFAYRVHDANNLAATQKMKNIKLLTDTYAVTQSYTDAELECLKLKKEDLINTFVRHFCINVPFLAILRRNFAVAYHHFFFGLSSYPKKLLRYWKFYFVLISLPFVGIYKLVLSPFKLLVKDR
jgi:glycosyltransferase involved in cell wall biosynthesis